MPNASLTIDGTEVLKKENGEVYLNNTNFIPPNPFTFRNRIINGDMRIDQRNAGSEVTFNSTFIFPVDRVRSGGIGAWSGSADIRAIQSTDAPAGFANSVKIYTNSTAASSSTDTYCLTHVIEGYQIADFNFGTSDAKSFTLSFYVKGTAGTYGFGFQVGSGMYVTTYTVTSSWNRIVINIPASTTYSPTSTTNSYGLNLLWDLGAGSNFETTTLNQWTANTTKSRTSSCIQFGATTGAELFITGVQLEEGTVATPFEHRPIGVELSLCQRYYYKIVNYRGQTAPYNAEPTGANGWSSGSTEAYRLQSPHPVEMRATPDFNFLNVDIWDTNQVSVLSIRNNNSTKWIRSIDYNLSGNLSAAGNIASEFVMPNGYIYCEAEL